MNWIKIEDELPIEFENVLVRIKYDKNCDYEVNWREGNNFYNAYSGFYQNVDNITHWCKIIIPEGCKI